MADMSNIDPEALKKLNLLLDQIEDKATKSAAITYFEKMAKYSRDTSEALAMTKRQFVDIIEDSNEFLKSTMAILNESSRYNEYTRAGTKARRKLLDIAIKIQDNDKGITQLTTSQLEKLQETVSSNLNQLKISADQLALEKSLTNATLEQIQNNRSLSDAEKSLLITRLENYENEKEFLNSIEARVENQKEFNRIGGLTTTLLSNLNRVGLRALGGFGLNLDSIKESFEQANFEVRTQIIQLQASNQNLTGLRKSVADYVGRWKIFGSALPGIGSALVKTLGDPLVSSLLSLDQIQKRFKEINEASVNLTRLTGQNISLQASFNTKLVTATEYLKLAAELTKQTGLNVNNAFSSDVLGSVAELQTFLGITAEQAGKLAIFSGTNSKSVDQNLDTLVDTVSTYNRINRTVVSQGVVLQDVLNTSDDIAASFGGQVDKLAEAGAAARRLGLELKELDGIAGSLLDFESSISAELEAQLLTGRNFNLTRARELALSNGLAGVGKELFDNSASLLEFSSMNRIQQEAQAKALGLSRQQLAKIALQRSIELGITNEQLEAAARVTAEDLKRVETFKSFTIAIEKLGAALAGPLDLVASILGNALALNTVLGTIGAISLIKLIRTLKLVNLQLQKSAIGAYLLRSGISPGQALAGLAIGGVVVAGVVGAISKSFNKIDSINDGMVTPEGLVVKSPKGTVQLNKNDSIIAGTNLISKEKPGISRTNLETSKAIVEQSRSMKRVETLLENILTKTGNVYIDGNKAGEAMVLSTYKLS